jgi:galactokinase
VREIERRAAQAYRERFGAEPEVVASAPGRVNLIGEHTDYNGGYVMPCAIDPRVAVAAGMGEGTLYSVDIGATRPASGPPDRTWADYPRGVAWSLGVGRAPLPAFRATITGEVPRGAGLSSSAAIEAATALALDALFGLHIERRELAVTCRRAENAYLSVNSGIMDQYASLLCQAGNALLIDCRSLGAEQVPLRLERAGLALLVCNTNVARGLRNSEYNARQAACARAAEALGVRELRDAKPADLTRLAGEDLKRARHVVTEDERVLEAAEALRAGDFATFGQLMYASHASLRDDYEVSTPELDAFVDVARALGAPGARLTGAGFGGCAIAIVAAQDVDALESAARERYAERGFKAPTFDTFHPSAGGEVVH